MHYYRTYYTGIMRYYSIYYTGILFMHSITEQVRIKLLKFLQFFNLFIVTNMDNTGARVLINCSVFLRIN